MYLFINVAITEKRLGPFRPTRNNRVDIFKYCLSSLSVLPWDEVFIHYVFYDDENLKDRKNELENYIQQEYKNHKLNLYNSRSTKQSEWKQALQPILDAPKNAVWYMCNDDHIFLDSNINTILSARQIIENSSDNIAMYISHWPEMLKMAQKQNNGKQINQYFQSWEAVNHDSLIFCHKRILEEWWFHHDYGDRYMPRSDPFAEAPSSVIGPPIKMLVPIREQCRHFEGYPHIGIPAETCPDLEIPSGFFDNKIDITIPNRTLKHSKDIPYFWKNKLNNIIINNENDEERIQHILMVANSRPNEPHLIINNEIIQKAYSI